MESWRGLFCLACLCLLTAARGQGDFDLADALDDPEPTKKPSSGIYPKPKPPYPPRPAVPTTTGEVSTHRRSRRLARSLALTTTAEGPLLLTWCVVSCVWPVPFLSAQFLPCGPRSPFSAHV
nr:glycoprotein Xg [Camelus dromedarius]